MALDPHPKDNVPLKFRHLRTYAADVDKAYARKTEVVEAMPKTAGKVDLIERVTSVKRG